MGHSRRFATSFPNCRRRFRGSRRFDLFEPLPPSNARERLRPRPRVPPGRTRPGAPARTFARLAASHVGARLVSRGAAGPKDRRDAPGAESSSPLLVVRREPRLEPSEARSRGDARGCASHRAPRGMMTGSTVKHSPIAPMRRRVRLAPRSTRAFTASRPDLARRSMPSRVPRKRAAEVTPRARLTPLDRRTSHTSLKSRRCCPWNTSRGPRHVAVAEDAGEGTPRPTREHVSARVFHAANTGKTKNDKRRASAASRASP